MNASFINELLGITIYNLLSITEVIYLYPVKEYFGENLGVVFNFLLSFAAGFELYSAGMIISLRKEGQEKLKDLQ